MKKLILLILVVTSIMMCFAGCGILDSLLGKSVGVHEPMLYLEKINTNRDNPEKDVLREEIWTVYYDGIVEYEAHYSRTGTKNEKSWEIGHDEIEEINQILYNMKDVKDRDGLTDGQSHWKFTYTKEDGTVISSYTVSYNTHKSLKEVIQMITE